MVVRGKGKGEAGVDGAREPLFVTKGVPYNEDDEIEPCHLSAKSAHRYTLVTCHKFLNFFYPKGLYDSLEL